MKFMKNLLISGAVTAGLLLNTSVVSAADSQIKAKNEGWDVPSVALGNGLTSDERLKTLEFLGVKETDSFNEFTVNGDDLVRYVTDVPEFTSASLAYSSAYIVRTKDNSGVNVEIVTPQNITARTEANYRNAAITSGVYDADIRIASVRVMDGSGALAGIYKIYDEVDPAMSEEEKQERAASRDVAQKESAVTAEITQANENDENFSDENLAVAMADIKLELQKINEKLGQLSESEVRQEITQIVQVELQNQGLSEIVTPEQQDKIVDTMVAFQNSPSIDNENLQTQLGELKDDIMKNGKDFLDNAKEKLTSEEAQGFFSNLWNKITSFFSNLFG